MPLNQRISPSDLLCTLLLACLLALTGCATPKPGNEAPTKTEASSGDTESKPPLHPGACSVETETDLYPGQTRYMRQIWDQSRLMQQVRDKDGDGVYDSVELFTYDAAGRRWSKRRDRDADAELDARFGPNFDDDGVNVLMHVSLNNILERHEDDAGDLMAIEGKDRDYSGGDGRERRTVAIFHRDSDGRATAAWLFYLQDGKHDTLGPRRGSGALEPRRTGGRLEHRRRRPAIRQRILLEVSGRLVFDHRRRELDRTRRRSTSDTGQYPPTYRFGRRASGS